MLKKILEKYEWFCEISSLKEITSVAGNNTNSDKITDGKAVAEEKLQKPCKPKQHKYNVKDPNLEEFDKATHTFNTNYRYCLITNCASSEAVKSLKALGYVQWLKVFDFDFDSRSEGGVLYECEEIVKKSQSLSITTWKTNTEDDEESDDLLQLEISTSSKSEKHLEWFFPRGNKVSREAMLQGDDKEWNKKTKDAVQQRCNDIINYYGITPVFVLILWYCENPAAKYLKRLLHKLSGIVENVVVCYDKTVSKEDKTQIAKWYHEDEFEFDEFQIISSLSLQTICLHLEAKFEGKSSSITQEYLLPSAQGPDICVTAEDRQELEECLEVLYTEVPHSTKNEDVKQDVAINFYRGGSLPWDTLRMNQYDAKRDKQDEITKKIEKCIENGDKAVLELHHRPGSGGSTLAKRVLWETSKSKTAVCVELKPKTRATHQITESIVQLWKMTDLPIVILSDSDLANVRELVNSLRGARVIILSVKRYTGEKRAKTKEGKFMLEGDVSMNEATDIAKKLCDHGKIQLRKKALKKLAEDVQRGISHRMYEFGLTAYGIRYHGLTSYVSGNLEFNREEGLNWWQRILAYLALVDYYGHDCIPAYLFSMLRLLRENRVGKNGTYYEYLPAGAKEMIVMNRVTDAHATIPATDNWTPTVEIWKIRYYEVSKEILEQLLYKPRVPSPQHGQSTSLTPEARNRLADFVCRFLDDISRVKHFKNSVVSSDIMDIVLRTVINREDTESVGKKRMSFLIFDIPDSPAQTERLKVLKKLTDCFRGDASVWAHRGRYTAMFSQGQDDENRAREFFETAVRLRRQENCRRRWDRQFSNILNMFATFLKDVVRRLIKPGDKFDEESMRAPDGKFHQIIETAISFAQEAVEKFVDSRYLIAPGEENTYGYVGEIHTRLEVINMIATYYKPNGLSGYLANDKVKPGNIQFLKSCLSECDSLIVECEETVSDLNEAFWVVNNKYIEVMHGAEEAIKRWKGDTNTPQNRRAKVALLKRRGKERSHQLPNIESIKQASDLPVVVDLLKRNLEDPAEDEQHIDMDMVEWLRAIRHNLFDDNYLVEDVLLQVTQLSDTFTKSRWAKFYVFILNVMLGLGIRSKSGSIRKAQSVYLQKAKFLLDDLKRKQNLYRGLRQKREWLGKASGKDNDGIRIKSLVMDKTLPRQHKFDYYLEKEVQEHFQIRSGEVAVMNPDRCGGAIYIDDGLEVTSGGPDDTKPERIKAFFVPKYVKGKLSIGQRVEFHICFNSSNFIQAYNVEGLKIFKCENPICNKSYQLSSLSIAARKKLLCKCGQNVKL